MARLDGNALAGIMADALGWDATAAPARCAGCGVIDAFATAIVYMTAMGSVARCRHCDAVLATFVTGPGGRAWFGLAGVSAIQIVR